ncbi:MAG TPA: hypothetical protein VGF89_08160 [Steroidobacteraceae bacterium]|jgi:hypothetical protein
MAARQVALYFAWSRPDEIAAPFGTLEDRFPALFELRRMHWPQLEQFADPNRFDQGIGGFLDHVQLANFKRFTDLAASWTANPVRLAQRRTDAGLCVLDENFLRDVDTLIVISFDSSRTQQRSSAAELSAIRSFLDDPGHTLCVCPHHDIGNTDGLPDTERLARQEIEFHHHGDPGIPARQCFGDFGIALLHGLGLSVKNRFGLRPAKMSDGSPAPLGISSPIDRAGLLEGVTTFNLHPHLPHFERLGEGIGKLEVLARQLIDPRAPPHPFTAQGRRDFDVLLQSNPDVFRGRVLICDATTWSSTVGGVESLQRFWHNVAMLQKSSLSRSR